MSLPLLLAIAVSLAAGVAAWVGGRRMLRVNREDGLFVERLFAHRMKMTYIHCFLLVIAATLAGKFALAVGGFGLLAIAIGGFPARRTLYGETWTLAEYLGSRVLLLVTAGAPWIAIMAAPQVLQSAGVMWAAPLALVTFALLRWQQPLLLVGLRAAPLRDEALLQLLNPILDRTQAPRPRIFAGGAETGQFTNAFALADGKRSRVVLTRALLRELEPQETAAIFAHEAAHLEEWHTRAMRIQLWLASIAIPLLAVGLQALLLVQYPKAATWMVLIWPWLFLFAVFASMVRRQAHESKADLRALELGADPHALIRALEKAHNRLGMPRRVDAPREARMTHPSLARRLQAIRKAAGLEVAPPPELPRTIDARLTFTAEAVELDGRAWRYDSFQSLLVRQTLRGWELMGRSGKQRLRVPLTAAGAADVQAILDSMDAHFAARAAARPNIARNTRLAALLLALLAMFPSISFAAVAAALLALISGGTPAIAAAGAAGIAAGVFAWIREPSAPFIGDAVHAVGLAVALIGVICLLLAAKMPAEDRQRHLRTTLIVLGAFTAIALAVAFVFFRDFNRPSIVICLAGITSALAFAGRWRIATVPAVAAIAFVVAGTFMPGMSKALVRPPKPIRTRVLDGLPTALRLSPGGRAFAVRITEPDEEPSKFAIAASTTSPLAEVAANDVAFIDEKNLLRVQSDGSKSVLDSIDLTGNARSWNVALPLMGNPQLQAEGGQWTATDETTLLYGAIGQSGYQRKYVPKMAAASMTAREGGSTMRGSHVASYTPTRATIWNLETRKAMRIGCDDCMILGVALSDRAAGVLLVRDQTTALELYSTDALR